MANKWKVVGSTSTTLTMRDGDVRSVSPGEEVDVRRDRRFRQAKQAGELQEVSADDDEDEEPETETEAELESEADEEDDPEADDEESDEGLLPDTPLSHLEGLSDEVPDILEEQAGIRFVSTVENMSNEELDEIKNIGEQRIEDLRSAIAAHRAESAENE